MALEAELETSSSNETCFSSRLTGEDVLEDFFRAKTNDMRFLCDDSALEKAERDLKVVLAKENIKQEDEDIKKVLDFVRLHNKVQNIVKEGHLVDLKEKTQKLIQELSDQLK